MWCPQNVQYNSLNKMYNSQKFSEGDSSEPSSLLLNVFYRQQK